MPLHGGTREHFAVCRRAAKFSGQHEVCVAVTVEAILATSPDGETCRQDLGKKETIVCQVHCHVAWCLNLLLPRDQECTANGATLYDTWPLLQQNHLWHAGLEA